MSWITQWRERRQEQRLTRKLNKALDLATALNSYGYDNACQAVTTLDHHVIALFYVNSGEDAYLVDQVLDLCTNAASLHSEETREKLVRLYDQIAETQRIAAER